MEGAFCLRWGGKARNNGSPRPEAQCDADTGFSNFERMFKPVMSVPILILHIDGGPSYYFNSRAVPASDLPRVVQDTLTYRFQKVVFLQADPTLGYADVVFAIDAIQGAGAKTVLVTSEPPPN
jgi:hypothetical protein